MMRRQLRLGTARCRPRIVPYQPEHLLPPDLQEWVPPGHLAHHVSDVVDALDLTAFYAPYEGDGRRNAPYEPSMMVKVLIYAYATGKSRAVARKLEEDVACWMLAAGNFPHRADIWRSSASSFVGVVRRARWAARFGKLSVDGTKVRANGKRKAMSYERMGKEAARLQADALLTKAWWTPKKTMLGRGFQGRRVARGVATQEKRLAATRQPKRVWRPQRGRDDRARARAWAGPQSPGRAALQC